MSCETYEPLLSAWVDGELDDTDRAALRVHLEGCGRCRRAADELAAVSRSTREALVPPAPPAGPWDRLAVRVVRRISRRGGWWLLVPATALLAGYGGYQFATDETVDALVKIGVAGGTLGLALLLLSVVLDRLRDRRVERYGEVER